MTRTLTLLFVLIAAMLLQVGGVSASQKRLWPDPIGLSISGTKTVDPNVAMGRYIIVKNNTPHTIRRIGVMLTPRTVIVKSRKPFKTIKLQVYAPQTTARWTFLDIRLRPKYSMRIPVMLKFPTTGQDGGSNFGIILDAEVLTRQGASSSHIVVFHINTTG